MSGLILLGVGLACALIARVLLISAAFRISWKWGLGVLLPFGPMLFRRNYPDQAAAARPFQLATIPCLLLYFFLVSGTGGIPSFHSKSVPKQTAPTVAKPARGYAAEKPTTNGKSSGLLSAFKSGPTIEERKAANAREFQQLALKEKELKIRKRDLLKSDAQGNAAYNKDLADYNTALANANKEKAELAAAKP